MNPEISYPAKLLLFGEYSILLGSSALGIPFKAFEARLGFIDQKKGDDLISAEQSNMILKQLCKHYMEKSVVFDEFIDLDRFRTDVLQGLYLGSTIPQRFGMGSSGALCAALYGRYNKVETLPDLNKEQLKFLRERFIQMEAFFHGKSSGFDPLVIYLQKTILLGNNGEAIPVSSNQLLNNHSIEILLIDSGIPRKRAPFVKQFLDEFVPGGVVSPAAENLISLTDSCIEKIVSDDLEDFWKELLQLSRFQLEKMAHLIPKHMQTYWSEGLQNGLFALKLCGSGGGGYLTCFTGDRLSTVSYFRNKKVGVVEIQ